MELWLISILLAHCYLKEDLPIAVLLLLLFKQIKQEVDRELLDLRLEIHRLKNRIEKLLDR